MKTINLGNYYYVVDVKQKVKPNDYCYMSALYNDSKKGFIIKVTDKQRYPKTECNSDWSEKEDGSVYCIDVLTPEFIGKNRNDNKVYIPKSYHISHCNSHGSGKIIETNNPNITINN